MNITDYSLMTAIIWFDLFILLINLLRKKLGLFLGYNLFPLILLIALTAIRLFIPIEFPFTIVLTSDIILPAINTFLKRDVSTFGTFHLSIWLLLVIIISTVSFVLLCRFFIAFWRSERQIKKYIPTTDKRLIEISENVRVEIQSHRSNLRIVHRDAHFAHLCGFFTPTIVLPERILTMSDAEVIAILKHEWQHYVSKDLWVIFLVEILCRVMWWNPLIFLLKRNLNRTLELKCDVRVTDNMKEEEKFAYLYSLIKIFKTHNALVKERRRITLGLYFTGSTVQKLTQKNTDAIQRFYLVLEHGRRNRKLSAVSTVALSALFLASFLFVIQPFIVPPMDDFVETMDDLERIQNQIPLGDDINVLGIVPEDTYIINNQDGTYSCYHKNKLIRNLSEEDLRNMPYKEFAIIEK